MEKNVSNLIVASRKTNYLNNISLESCRSNRIYLEEEYADITDLDMYNKAIVAVSKSELFFVDIENETILDKLETGITAEKIKIYRDDAFILSSYSNSLIVYDLVEKEIKIVYKINDYPCSIELDKEEGRIYITSFLGGTIQIFDCINYVQVNQISNLNYPTKAVLSEDSRYIFVIESYCTLYRKGVLSIFDKKSLTKINTIKIGKIPADLVQIDNILAVCNLDDSVINIIDLVNNRVTFFYICGMINRLVRRNDDIICSDYSLGTIKILDFKHNKEKIIAKANTPSAMIVV